MQYRLLAVDMDNTLLDREKNIGADTFKALKQAAAQGCEIVFATGRSLIECRKYYDLLPEVRYFIGNTGATVMNVRTGRIFYTSALGGERVKAVIRAVAGTDSMATVHAGDLLYVAESVRKTLEHYGSHIYQSLFEETAEWVPDIYALAAEHAEETYKLDLFFHDPGEQKEVFKALSGLNLSLSAGSSTNIEVTAAGCSKGCALTLLCKELGVPMEEVAACGDNGNDVSMVSAAGLGAAVGNAIPELKSAAGVIVADCEHDGIAELINTYILR